MRMTSEFTTRSRKSTNVTRPRGIATTGRSRKSMSTKLNATNLVCFNLLQEDLIAGGCPLSTLVLLKLSLQSGDFLLRPWKDGGGGEMREEQREWEV